MTLNLRRAAAAAALVGAAAFGTVVRGRIAAAQDPVPAVRPWLITASRYKFVPARIEVSENDVVKIELRTEDIPHSLTIEAYRIAKRVNPGNPVTFEFRADQPGTFPFYCSLQIEDGCRQMRGQLVVRARP